MNVACSICSAHCSLPSASDFQLASSVNASLRESNALFNDLLLLMSETVSAPRRAVATEFLESRSCFPLDGY